MLSRLNTHDWDSIEPFDLLERLKLIQELKDMPMKELAKVLKNLSPELFNKISILLNKLDLIQDP